MLDETCSRSLLEVWKECDLKINGNHCSHVAQDHRTHGYITTTKEVPEQISLVFISQGVSCVLGVFNYLFLRFRLKGWCGYDDADPAVTMYEVMSGDTLAWKVPSPKQSDPEPSTEAQLPGEGGPVKILKVCFCINNNLGKNFKLVKCDSSWKIKVTA